VEDVAAAIALYLSDPNRREQELTQEEEVEWYDRNDKLAREAGFNREILCLAQG
jgi:hypothetical protein